MESPIGDESTGHIPYRGFGDGEVLRQDAEVWGQDAEVLRQDAEV